MTAYVAILLAALLSASPEPQLHRVSPYQPPQNIEPPTEKDGGQETAYRTPAPSEAVSQPTSPAANDAPDLAEELKRRIYQLFGLPGVVVMVVLGLATSVWWKWPDIKKRPGVSALLFHLSRREPTRGTDSVARGKLRSILLDAQNEVDTRGASQAELFFLGDLTARGVFLLLKDTAADVVAQNQRELTLLSQIVESYRKYRAEAAQLDAYTVDLVGKEINKYRKNHWRPYWNVVAGYCTLIAAGYQRDDALNWSKTQGFNHDGSDCEKIQPILCQDAGFRARVKTITQLRDQVTQLVKQIRSLDSASE